MNSKQTQFINILRQFASGQNAILPNDADMEALFNLSGVHSLSAVVCYAINHQIISGGFDGMQAAKKFQKSLFTTVAFQTERLTAFDSLLDVLNQKGIQVILMKGCVINQYYPETTLRTFGDIDFLIKPHQQVLLHDTMLELGYSFKKDIDTVYTYFKGIEKYEVHTELLPNRKVLTSGMLDFIDSAFDNIQPTKRENIFEFEPSYHFAFLLLHLAKHMRADGAGARMYLDLALMIKNEDSLDFEKVIIHTKKLELYDFLHSAIYLCLKWFGTKPTIELIPPNDNAFTLMQEYVISAGIFGLYERNPAIQRLRNEKRDINKKPALLTYIFPSYKSMKNKYKFLNGKPYLLPVVWIVRWFDGIFLRRKKAATIFRGMFTEGRAAEISEAMLNGIGIKSTIK